MKRTGPAAQLSQDRSHRRQAELLVTALVLLCCAYFFQGGGWNQNAHFATTVALIEQGTFNLDELRRSTGDLARTADGVVSVKPIGTALASIPAYLLSGPLTAAVDNPGNRLIARAYSTSLLGTGLALALFTLVLLRVLKRRLSEADAVVLTLAVALATPLFPYSTMVNSIPFVALCAMLCYSVLEAIELRLVQPSPQRCLGAGFCVGLIPAFEYLSGMMLLPLGLYALWLLRPGKWFAWFAAGIGAAALIPALHHTIVFGHPLKVGYGQMLVGGFARDAARGFFGISGFSLARLYDLTLGPARGYILVSPFLAAAIPGLWRMLRDPSQRARGLAAGGAAWLMLILVASLTYWHSGWSIVSRYGMLFVAMSAIPLAAVFPHHRAWIRVGMAVGLWVMLLAAAVTPTPPPPVSRPRHNTVIGWLWQHFVDGNLAIRNEMVLKDSQGAEWERTWHASFNLGQLLGLRGAWSLLPLLVLLGALGWMLWRIERRTQQPSEEHESRAQ